MRYTARMNNLSRRSFLTSTSLLAAAGALASCSRAGLARQNTAPPAPAPGSTPATDGDAHRGPCAIASANGLRATARARELIDQGYDPADAIVQGVRIIEDDADDDSVGLGGLPNADGIVELDASVIHGPTHKSGAVASIRDIKNPAMVALIVLRKTDHCLLVGEGAKRFALDHGFREENLLTDKARREWLDWKHNMSRHDDWLDDEELDAPRGKAWDLLPWQDAPGAAESAPRHNDGPRLPRKASMRSPSAPPGAEEVAGSSRPGEAPDAHAESSSRGAPLPGRNRWRIHEVTGTVHCSAVTPAGDIASCTSTSGLNWKIPGRVGDSPIIGAGNYCDNAIGAAGCTGRGEAAIVNLAAFRIVDNLSRGMSPSEACMAVAKAVAERTLEKRLRTPDGRPNFNVRFYALRKDGAYGCATLYQGHKFAVCDAQGPRLLDAPSLFPLPTPPQP